MAENGGVQQRAFSKNIKQHSAMQIRRSAIASVRAANEKASNQLASYIDTMGVDTR